MCVCVCVFPDFHELWSSDISVCLLTEVKRQWGYVSSGVGDHFTMKLRVLLISLQLELVHCHVYVGSTTTSNNAEDLS